MKLRSIAVAVIMAALILPSSASAIDAKQTDKKVVILCFDGMSAEITEDLMEKGLMPNLSKLAEQGSYRHMDTTNPPQTPVSWASFTTGWHPGKTQIFDFLKRDKGSYLPNYAQVTITSQKFMFGSANPIIFGAVAAAVLFLIVFITLRLITKKKKLSLFISSGVFVLVFVLTFLAVKAWVPIENTYVINNRKGTPFWDVLNLNGIQTKVFNIPVNFPAKGEKNGKLLSGLGVPDITGSIGKPAYFTTSRSFSPSTGEFTVAFTKLQDNPDGLYYTFISGPDRTKIKFSSDEKEDDKIDMQALGYIDEEEELKKTPKYMFENDMVMTPEDREEEIKIPMKLQVDSANKTVTIEVQGNKQTIKEGEWSDWYELEFKVNPLLSLWGIARFCLQEAAPDMKLYLSPIHLHPNYTPIPITSPKSWASDLYKKFGIYKTLGWAVDTWSLQEELIDEASFLEDAYYTRAEKELMLNDSLDSGDYQVHIQYYEYTDRIQHLFWRLIDKGHPYYKPEKAKLYEKAIQECYIDMDRMAGEVMEKIDDDTILFVISDHGFISWRRAVNYNTWLAQNGYIKQKQWDTRPMELEDLFGERSENFWPNVDWTKTKAYALGIGNIYINLEGREPNGCVKDVEYNKIRDEIVEKMPRTIDPKTGMKPIVAVYRREDIWDDFDPKITPDLRVTTNKYYRVSWQSTLGNIPEKRFYDVEANWSADHCSADPSLVKGILFCNRKVKKEKNPKLVDFLPTMLNLYGISAEEYDPDGVNLFEK